MWRSIKPDCDFGLCVNIDNPNAHEMKPSILIFLETKCLLFNISLIFHFFRRYVAICHPFISHTMSKLSRAVKFVVAIWLLALCLAVPQAIQFGIIVDYTDNGTANLDSVRCSLRWTLIEHAFEISTILFFVLPMTIITVLYVLIAIKLQRSSLLTTTISKRHHVPGVLNHADSNRGKTNAQRNVIRMLGKRCGHCDRRKL